MSTFKLYHNPRCQKSREAKELLSEASISFEEVLYMKEPLTPIQLEDLLDKLELETEDLIRKGEKIWKEEFSDKELSDDELILAMIEYPQLMQRPILESGEKAVVGRPPEAILSLIQKG